MNKRQLCYALATYEFKIPKDCQNDTTILGDNITDVPSHLIHTISENGKTFCFNILELMDLDKNPYTNTKLNKGAIKKRYKFLQAISHGNKEREILENIKNNPILTKEQLANIQLTNVLSKLRYPPPKTKILGMSQEQIKMLIEAIKSNPLTSRYISVRNSGSVSIQKLIPGLLALVNAGETEAVALEFYLNEIIPTNRSNSSRSSSRRSSVASRRNSQ